MRKVAAITTAVVMVMAALSFAGEGAKYSVKAAHKGGDVTPSEAYEMIVKDPGHTFIVDVRTQYEYQDIGHPVGSCNVPWEFYTSSFDKKGYKKEVNAGFCEDLKKKFNPDTDTLLILCRSGKRSTAAATAAVECGFPQERVFNVMGGFEGDAIKDENSKNNGMRMLNGWRFEGLPWTYEMQESLVYAPDVKN